MKKPQEISPQGIDYGAGHSQFPHPGIPPMALCPDPSLRVELYLQYVEKKRKKIMLA